MELGHMPVMINPAGTVYNPVSVSNTLDIITGKKKITAGDLYNHQGKWISFNHYTDFSSDNPRHLLNKINSSSEEALKFLSGARFLFITFGTARVYRWSKTGNIVSNCHKIAASDFTHEFLKVGEIEALWKDQLDNLHSLFPGLQVVFTISPVRHWKDGAHGNQVSKSVLFLAVEELLGHQSGPEYFPAYELVMDDLRDYRFYEDDMLHISPKGVDYIWDAFQVCYFDNTTKDLWQKVTKISKAVNHRIQTDSEDQINEFAANIISGIDALTDRNPFLNLENERKYFLGLLKDKKKPDFE
jgi:hypothetical protein